MFGVQGTVVAITHDRYFLDNVAGWLPGLQKTRFKHFKIFLSYPLSCQKMTKSFDFLIANRGNPASKDLRVGSGQRSAFPGQLLGLVRAQGQPLGERIQEKGHFGSTNGQGPLQVLRTSQLCILCCHVVPPKMRR